MTEVPDDLSTELLLTQSLPDLELAMRHVTERLDKVVWREIGRLIEYRIAAIDWNGEGDPESDLLWLTPADWMTPDTHKGHFEEDAWFEVAIDFGAENEDEEEDWSDLATFTGASSYGNRMMLCFKQQVVTARPARTVLAAQPGEALDQLRALGFEIDQRTMLIAHPVDLDAETVGRAFADGVFEEALSPLRRALDAAERAVPLLAPLVAKLRDARKSA